MTTTRFALGLAAIIFALLLLGFAVQWLVQDTFFWPEVAIVLLGSLGYGFFALRKLDLPGFTASFAKTRRGQLTATILAVLALVLAVGSGAGVVGFLLFAGAGWLLVSLAGTDAVAATRAHMSEHQPAVTLGPVNNLAKWSLGLGISACATFAICALALFRSNPSGQHLLALIVLPLFMSLVAAVVAIITGHMARRQIRRSGENGLSRARTGLICGYVFLAVFVLSFPLTSLSLLYTLCDPQNSGSCS